MPGQKKYTLSEARLKAEEYCAYRERCHKEVKDKLYSWGLPSDHVDAIMYELIQNNFLNEERYVEAFVSGKFKIKNWGKIKIRQSLQQKQINSKLIDQKLGEIDEADYQRTIKKVAAKKQKLTKGRNDWEKKQKLKKYLYSRGFEPHFIDDILQKLDE